MHRIARAASVFVVSSLFIAVQPARALDIVLTNDDGFESALTYALYQRLLEAGHRVLISASTADQSGRGGSVDFLRPIGPLTAATRGGCVVPPASPPTPGVGNLGLGAPFVRDRLSIGSERVLGERNARRECVARYRRRRAGAVREGGGPRDLGSQLRQQHRPGQQQLRNGQCGVDRNEPRHSRDRGERCRPDILSIVPHRAATARSREC